MIRSELLAALGQDYPDLRAEEVEQVVDIFFEEISQRLTEGGRVELRGFGAFSTREREARKGRNPRTGETVDVPAKRVPYFKPGKGGMVDAGDLKSPELCSCGFESRHPHQGRTGLRDADMVRPWEPRFRLDRGFLSCSGLSIQSSF